METTKQRRTVRVEKQAAAESHASRDVKQAKSVLDTVKVLMNKPNAHYSAHARVEGHGT